jgi:hypothetical protein
LQLAAGFLIGQLAAVRFQEMTCRGQCSLDSSKISGGRQGVGQAKFGNQVMVRGGVARFPAGRVEDWRGVP